MSWPTKEGFGGGKCGEMCTLDKIRRPRRTSTDLHMCMEGKTTRNIFFILFYWWIRCYRRAIELLKMQRVPAFDTRRPLNYFVIRPFYLFTYVLFLSFFFSCSRVHRSTSSCPPLPSRASNWRAKMRLYTRIMDMSQKITRIRRYK